jgi:hypothetical protein
MTNYKSGLQKNISAIFEDAPALNQDGSIVSPENSDAAAQKNPQPIQAENIQTPSESSQASSPDPATQKCPQIQTARTTIPLGSSLALKLANESNSDAKKTKITAGSNSNQPTRNAPARNPAPVKADTTRALPFKNIWEKAKNRFSPKPGLSTRRQVATVLLIPILAIVLIAVLINVFALPATKKARANTSNLSPSLMAASDNIAWEPPVPYPADLRDPMMFMRDTKIAAGSDDFFINGILHSKDKPTVIIGNRILHTGDRIGEALITKIDIRGVEFESNGRKWTQRYDTKNEIAEVNNFGKEVR